MKNLNFSQHLSIIFTALFVVAFFSGANAQIATGGTFALTQSVIAGGGGQNSTGGTFSLDGTIGQSVAGQPANGAPFNVYAGFWTPVALIPTSAEVSVSGRVVTANGRGIRNVLVTMSGASGEVQTAMSSMSGNFHFANVLAGDTYIFTARAKRFSFAQSTQVLSITEDVSDLVFVAEAQFPDRYRNEPD